MNNAIKYAGPDPRPIITFPFIYFHLQFAAIIIVIVAAAVAAAAKQFLKTAMECPGRSRRISEIMVMLPAVIGLQILEKVGMKSANVNGVVRALPVTMSGHA